MMRRTSNTLASMVASTALSLSMLVSATASPTIALAEDYSYTIRVFSGNKGDVNGQNVVTLKRHKGDAIDLTTDIDVGITDPSYYHKGFREAGRDDEFAYRTFDVDRDLDLVVSYGMRSQMAKLTVHFQEYQTGKPLATEDGQTEVTYEYKIGDKPVVPFKYIEGYRPLYRNLTGTITEDTNWYLDYVPLQPGEEPVLPTDNETIVHQSTTDATTGGTDGERSSNAQPSSSDGATGGNANGVIGNQLDTDENGTVSGDIYPPTQDIVDNDIPLSDALDSKRQQEPKVQDEPESSIVSWVRNHTIAVSVTSAVVIGLAMALIVLMVSKGRKKERRQ